MAVATERWSDRRQIQRIDGNWSILRAWDVIDYVDDADAITATGVKPGDRHPLNPSIKCIDLKKEEDKFTLCRVVARYEITSLRANPQNPLLRQPIVSWRWGKVSEPIDLDLSGNPILNAAGDAFRSPEHRNFSVRYLTIERYEPYYDQEQADFFTDTVNGNGIAFQGNTYDPGQVYCISYAPIEPYQIGSDYVHVAYQFEIRTPNAPNLTDMQVRHPFQCRILNQGTRAVYLSGDESSPDPLVPSLGQLYLSDGSAVSRDVLLDDTGIPVDDGIKVTAGLLDAVPQDLPRDVLVDEVTISRGDKDITVYFLVYMRYPEVDFSSLGQNLNGGEA